MKRSLIFDLAIPSLLMGGLSGSAAIAGEVPALSAGASVESRPDGCEWLSGKPGTFYKGGHPLIQELVIVGRFHWQAAYLWGEDANGYDFSDGYSEVRRFRMGVTSKFLNYFALKAEVDLVDDARNQAALWPGNQSLGWGYERFDAVTMSFDAKKAFGIDGVDALSLVYGRHKVNVGQEVHTSSNELLTVERSAIANKVYGPYRPTGFTLGAAKGEWGANAGLFSTDAAAPPGGGNVELLGGWNDGLAYYGSLSYQTNERLRWVFDFIYNGADVTRGEDSLWGYEWAASLAADYDAGGWGVIINGIYGDNGDDRIGNTNARRQGDFWGLVVMPHRWLVQDKLQAVARYQYAGSDAEQGTRVNSRYVRADHGPLVNGAIAGGRGDEHHSIYGGLNYYFCGHNLKVQSGLEYEWLNTPGAGTRGEVSALTCWFGFRSSF